MDVKDHVTEKSARYVRAQKPQAQSLQRPPDGTAGAQKVKLWPGTHTEAQLSSIATVVSFALLMGTEKR